MKKIIIIILGILYSTCLLAQKEDISIIIDGDASETAKELAKDAIILNISRSKYFKVQESSKDLTINLTINKIDKNFVFLFKVIQISINSETYIDSTKNGYADFEDVINNNIDKILLEIQKARQIAQKSSETEISKQNIVKESPKEALSNKTRTTKSIEKGQNNNNVKINIDYLTLKKRDKLIAVGFGLGYKGLAFTSIFDYGIANIGESFIVTSGAYFGIAFNYKDCLLAYRSTFRYALNYRLELYGSIMLGLKGYSWNVNYNYQDYYDYSWGVGFGLMAGAKYSLTRNISIFAEGGFSESVYIYSGIGVSF